MKRIDAKTKLTYRTKGRRNNRRPTSKIKRFRIRRPTTGAPNAPKITNTVLGCDPLQGTTIGGLSEDTLFKISRDERKFIQERAKEKQECLPPLVIENLLFTLFDFKELENISVADIHGTEPNKMHGVNDKRMGVVDTNQACYTCKQDNITCPGHYGMIKFSVPIIHPLFQREVIDVLTSVCNSCGELLLTEEEIKEKGINNLTGAKRLRALAEQSQGHPCRQSLSNKQQGTDSCGPNPIYKPARAKDVKKIVYTFDDKKTSTEMYRTPEEILRIFNIISDEDAKLLGFRNNSHPRRMILQGIPVIPPCARPPVVLEGRIQEDHLTKMYNDIVRYNNSLKNETSESEREKLINKLTFAVEHLIDNTDGKYCQGHQHPYVSIKQRIQGKEAIIRGLLMGKRVDFSARTVLSPDPSLKFGQIRIPRAMAPYLTVHEVVNASNIKQLGELFSAGKVTTLTPRSGRRANVRIKVTERVRETHILQIGDEVDRWLQNGDRIVFNRQPSLSKYSMLAADEVVLGDQLTIGLHPAYTTPLNADFDGDEGNLHAPQTMAAAAEIASFMNVKNCLLGGQSNRNVIGVVMDGILGSYIMTHFNPILSSSEYFDMLNVITNTDSHKSLPERLRARHLPRMSGRGLFSALFPEGFEYRKGDVVIEDGILVQGSITKKHVGIGQGSIIQVMVKDFGINRTVDFLTDIYFLTTKFLDYFPVSVGLDDCFLEGEDPQREIRQTIQKAKMNVQAMGTKLADPLEEERREKSIIAKLNTARGLGARISKNLLPEFNAFQLMVKSGSKGSDFNIAQITGMLGQQYIKGQRIPLSITGGKRTLPYFRNNELDPEARGFVTNSFLSGLTPAELFFHQAAGRVGLIDTANKTQETGYIHHRMVKALEDIKVHEDGSVRNASGAIFQYTYGDDGLDPSKLETVKLKSGSFASFVNVKRLAARINTRYGYPSVKMPTGEPPAIAKFEPGQIYDINGREASVISSSYQFVEHDGTSSKQRMVELIYNDTDKIVWKKPSEIGKRITNPSKYVNVYRINDREAIIIGRQVAGFNFLPEGALQSVFIPKSTTVIPGGSYIVNGRKGEVISLTYDYQIKYLDNGSSDVKHEQEIGAPVRKATTRN